MDFRLTSLAELSDQIQDRTLSARDLVGHALERVEALEPRLNAWAALDGERAMAEATAVDDRLASGDPVGPLAGIPIGVKDLEPAVGFTTSYGSALHVDDPVAEADSPLVARLRAAGCVVLGKTTT
ncbi:MAG: amidase family protein, partial [Acidimicrobiales bacterium]